MAARTITVASVVADFATLSPDDMGRVRAALAIKTEPRPMSEAAQHFVNRDLPCPDAGDKCRRADGTVRMFRGAKGIAIHRENFAGKSHDQAKSA